MTLREWDIWKNGTKAEWDELHRELWARAFSDTGRRSKATEEARGGPTQEQEEQEMRQWADQHQEAREAERAKERRRTELDAEIERLEEELRRLDEVC